MRIDTESSFEVGVDAGQVHPVIQWQEHKSDHHVTQQVTEHDLEIKEITGSYTAWYAHKCDT